jgi:hypothetical protein
LWEEKQNKEIILEGIIKIRGNQNKRRRRSSVVPKEREKGKKE